MCFSTKKLILKQAKRDKVFYKVLEQINAFSISNKVSYKYITPYREMEVNLGKWYNSSFAIVDFCDADMTLGEGVFHLFKNRKSAESLVKRNSHKYIVVKAIVPKGAFYATNNDNEVITSEVRYEKLTPKKTFKFWKR